MCEALGLCCPCQTRLILLLQVGSTCRIKSASCIFLKIGYLCQSLDRYIATVIVLLRFSTIGHLQYMSVLIYSMKPKSYSSVNERRKTSTSVWQDYKVNKIGRIFVCICCDKTGERGEVGGGWFIK